MYNHSETKFVPNSFHSDFEAFSALAKKVSELEGKVKSLQEQLSSVLPPQVFRNDERVGREL